MNEPVKPESRRDELRRRWLAHAAAAFDLMFDPQYQDSLQTFDQRITGLRQGTSGAIRIGVANTAPLYYVADVLRDFVPAYPQVSVTVDMDKLSLSGAVRHLISHFQSLGAPLDRHDE